jgi:hypothetical protein
MTLIIEDGTGVADADSFQTLAEARALALNYGLTIATDDTAAEVQLRQGYIGLLVSERTLQGARTHTIQTGIYPRTGAYSNCNLVDSESIPNSVKLAQLNFADAINSGYGTNSVDNGQDVKSFTVPDVYQKVFQDGSSIKTNAGIQGVDNALYPLTLQGYANSPCGRASGAGGLTRFEPF